MFCITFHLRFEQAQPKVLAWWTPMKKKLNWRSKVEKQLFCSWKHIFMHLFFNKHILKSNVFSWLRFLASLYFQSQIVMRKKNFKKKLSFKVKSVDNIAFEGIQIMHCCLLINVHRLQRTKFKDILNNILELALSKLNDSGKCAL